MDWKSMVLNVFHKLGYDVYRIGSKQEYTICPPYDNYYSYSPWFEDWFQQIYNKFRDHTLLEEHRCYIIYHFAAIVYTLRVTSLNVVFTKAVVRF